jgi:uncharacterized membrane protein YjgN (DUF898 family)
MQTDSSPIGPPGRRADPSAYRIDTRDGIEPFPMEFSGSGGEFFRVWIVNLLLTIVTLGFYTPFARRRTAQYFYSHTQVAGSPLEFTAQQGRMVVGFLLLVAIYIAFQLAADTGQDAARAVLFLAAAVLAPYFWASAMRFRLGATRWRGVRLQFAASWAQVYKASWPAFVIALVWAVTAGVIGAMVGDVPALDKGGLPVTPLPDIPALVWLLLAAGLVGTFLCIVRLEYNYKGLLVSRAFVGAQAGRWKPVYRDFLRIWLATLGVFIAGVLVVAALTALVVGGSFFAAAGAKPMSAGMVLAFIGALVGVLFGLLFASAPARAYRQARMFQLVWNNVGVSTIARFKCKLRTRRFVMLRIKNMVLTLITLGFYRPFALVSEYRMKCESVTLHVKGGLDQLVGALVRQQDGLGDALADAVGLDLVG